MKKLGYIFRKHFDPDASERVQVVCSGWPVDRQDKILWLSFGFNVFYSHPAQEPFQQRNLCITLCVIVDISIWIIIKRPPQIHDFDK